MSLPDFFDLTDEDVATIAQLTSLHDLKIGWVGSGPRRLPKLDVEGVRAATDVGIAPLIERNPSLKTVNWTGGTVDGRTLAALGRLTGLVELHLREIRMDDEALAGLTPATKLRELTLAGAPIGDAGLAHLARLPQLQILDLRRTRVTSAGMVHLAQLPNLTQLNLDETAIDDAGLLALHPRVAALDLLSLHGTRITDAGVVTLADAGRLMTLDLGGTQLSDASLPVLGRLPQLHGLYLSGAGTTAAGEASIIASRPYLSLFGHPQQAPPGWGQQPSAAGEPL